MNNNINNNLNNIDFDSFSNLCDLKELMKNFYLQEESLISKIKDNKKELKIKIYEMLYKRFYLCQNDDNFLLRKKLEEKIIHNFFIFYFSNELNENIKKIFYLNNEKDFENDKNKIINEIYITIFNHCEKFIIENTENLEVLPNFLIYYYKKLLKFKINNYIIKNYLFYSEKDSFLKSKEFLYLKKIYNKFLDRKILLFDESKFNENIRINLLKLLIFANCDYINKNIKNQTIFCNNLKKYIMILGLKNKYNELVLIFSELIKKNKNEINKEINDIKNIIFNKKNKNNNNNNKNLSSNEKFYLQLIFNFSFLLNSFLIIHQTINDNQIKYEIDFVNKFKLSAKERIFLNNILIILKGKKINFYIENYIFIPLIKKYIKNLKDDNYKLNVILNYEKISNSILNFKEQNYIKKTNLNKKNLDLKNENDFLYFSNLFENFINENENKLNEKKNFFKIFDKNKIYYHIKDLILIPNNIIKNYMNVSIIIEGNFFIQNKKLSFDENFDINDFIFSGKNCNCDFYSFKWQNKNNFYNENNKNFQVAKFFGEFLAFIIASRNLFQFQTINLIGFSLGCLVIKFCLKELKKFPSDLGADDIINDVIFIAGADEMKENEYEILFNNFSGRLINFYNKNDDNLKKFNENSFGLRPIINNNNINDNDRIINIDLTNDLFNNVEYKTILPRILNEKIKLY